MKEVLRANARSLLLTVLILSNSAVALAYYHPDEGRWISRDPIGEQGGKNLYVFVMNNAIYLIDARGHSPKDVIKIYRVYRTTVNAMTSAEERNPNPVKNNEMRSIYDLKIYDSEGNRLVSFPPLVGQVSG